MKFGEMPNPGAQPEREMSPEEWGKNVDQTERILNLSKIRLPEDPELKTQLEAKLAEYRERMSDPKYQNSEEAMKELKYREMILSILLSPEPLVGGKLDGDSVKKGLYFSDPEGFDDELFEEAFKLIKDYAETGGKNVRGGTGLKK